MNKKIKFPALKEIKNSLVNTTVRFTETILFSAFVTILLITTTYRDIDNEILFRWLFPGFLGIPFSLYCCLLLEKKTKYNFKYRIFFFLIILSILSLYFISLDEIDSPVHYYRFFLLLTSGFILVTFSKIFNNSSDTSYWHFSKLLFFRFIISFFFSMVLYLGLTLAIVAVKELFIHDMNNEIFLRLFYFCAIFFNTFFFLTIIPSKEKLYEDESEYPGFVKILAGYFLIPLSLTYLIILYAYSIKIIIEGHLPEGWIAYLVTGFSLIGTIALMLVYPIRDNKSNLLIYYYNKWYFMFFLPLVFLLGIAVFTRISAYGITENRYYLLIYTFWLFSISLYYIFSKSKSIKIIPVSVFIILLLSLYGPWSAFSVSEKSQTARLKFLLEKNNLLNNGKIIPTTQLVTSEDKQNLYTIISYLIENHGINIITPMIPDSISKNFTNDHFYSRWSAIQEVASYMKIENYYYNENPEMGLNIYKSYSNLNHVSGFDVMFDCNYYSGYMEKNYDIHNIPVFEDTNYSLSDIKLTFDSAQQLLKINYYNSNIEIAMNTLISNIREYVKTHPESDYNYLPDSLLLINKENDVFKTKITFIQLNTSKSDNKEKINSLTMRVLLGKNEK